jgi:hypothetical protein
MGDACRRIVQTKPEHRARLITAGARCASGCVYAMLGASVRQVGRAAELGIHSVRYLWALSGPAPSAPPSTDVAHEGLRNYVVEMGTDPGLIDAAAKVSADRVHWMTRAEIDRFGIETHGFYETRWTALQETPLIFSVSKAWTRAEAGGNDYRTTVIRLRCSSSSGFLLTYRSEAPLFEPSGRLQVRLTLGGHDVPLARMFAQVDGTISYTAVARDVMQRTAAEPRLEIREARGVSEERPFSVSTAGLSEALGQLQKQCDKRREPATPAAVQTH